MGRNITVNCKCYSKIISLIGITLLIHGLDFLDNYYRLLPHNQLSHAELYVHTNVPLHSTSLGSGSHSPFLLHVDVLGPRSTCSGGQLKETVVPSSAGLL